MNQLAPYEAARERIMSCEPQFNKLSQLHGQVVFEKESVNALQILQKNDYLSKIAQQNPASLVIAITNVAAIGITLTPSQKLAYLIPRKGQICLDLSYMGLVYLAVKSGSVSWVQAEIVRETDTFTLQGIDKAPIHAFDPFKERGKIIGVYSVAKLPSGDFLTETMPLSDVYEIRNRSDAWKNSGKGPWLTDEGEMIKKTVIKRASKLWPTGDGRLGEAIEVLNENEGIDFKDEFEDDFPIPPEEKAIGNYYRFQNGKHRKSQLKDFDLPQLEEYQEFLKNQLSSKNAKGWHSDQLEVITTYINEYEHHRQLLESEDE